MEKMVEEAKAGLRRDLSIREEVVYGGILFGSVVCAVGGFLVLMCEESEVAVVEQWSIMEILFVL
ncbi:MAG TPA: hypothetical protein DDY68_00810, partial [Porphyromonadaceae bacterium]|nr:hypothetical protein [Porphyromonadaceae bacterium]